VEVVIYMFFCILVVQAVLLLSLKQEIRHLKKRFDAREKALKEQDKGNLNA